MSASSHTESSHCQGERPDVSQFIHLISHSIGGTPEFMTIFNLGIITVNRTGGTNVPFFIHHNCVLRCERKGVLQLRDKANPIKTRSRNTN